jgi:hypothetical protein
VRMTREALYEEVWARPVAKVPAELGVSDVGLRKICARHRIPTPRRGYWAKVKHQKPTEKPPLPKLSDGRLADVEIAGGGERVPESVAQAKLKALAQVANLQQASLDGTDPEPGDHHVLAATRWAISKARPGLDGFCLASGRGVVGLKLGPTSADRALRVLSRLMRLADALGYGHDVSEAGLRLVVNGEPIGFRVDEQRQETLHQPTAAEQRAKAERLSWGSTRDPWPKYDNAPSGRLTLVVLGNEYSGLRRTFAERKTRPLDALLPGFLAGLVEHAALKKSNRVKAEEARRVEGEWKARRALEAAFEAREKRRVEFVDALQASLDEHARLSRVLVHLDSAEGDERCRTEAMAAWVRQRLRLIEARVSPVFLDISARWAEIDFDEERARAKPDAGGEFRYCARPVALQLWAIDEEKGLATSMSELDWVRADNDLANPSTAVT